MPTRRAEWSDVLAVEVLTRLDPTDLVLFGQAGRACRAAVVAFGVPQEEVNINDDSDDSEGAEGGLLLLRVRDFVGSVERLAWAKARGCPWVDRICAWAARHGHLKVLKWAWERRCPWDNLTCAWAALNGHLEVPQWARQHGCDWTRQTCLSAAFGGHLDVLRWSHEHGCPWCEYNRVARMPLGGGTCACCSMHGSTAARGIRGRAPAQPWAGTWMC